MDKSINDINSQAQRIVSMLQYPYHGWRSPSVIYDIALSVASRRGLNPFGPKDVKGRWSADMFRQPAWGSANSEPVITAAPVTYAVGNMTKKEVKPMTPAEDREYRKRLQELARHQLLSRLLSDILTDMAICRLENWNLQEYPNMIKRELDRILTEVDNEKMMTDSSDRLLIG